MRLDLSKPIHEDEELVLALADGASPLPAPLHQTSSATRTLLVSTHSRPHCVCRCQSVPEVLQINSLLIALISPLSSQPILPPSLSEDETPVCTPMSSSASLHHLSRPPPRLIVVVDLDHVDVPLVLLLYGFVCISILTVVHGLAQGDHLSELRSSQS